MTYEGDAKLMVPSPLPRKIVTVSGPAFATARSALPSPLKSPTATDAGIAPSVPTTTAWLVTDAAASEATSTTIVIGGTLRLAARRCAYIPAG